MPPHQYPKKKDQGANETKKSLSNKIDKKKQQ
jgi:hypothetical protein